MGDQRTQSDARGEGSCPRCGEPVDALRAGAVSIVDGRIVHFCSAECREAHLRRGFEPEPAGEPPAPTPREEERTDAGEATTAAVEAPPEASADGGTAPLRPHRARVFWGPTARLILPEAVWLLALGGALAAAIAVPASALRGLVPLGLAASAALALLVAGVVRNRDRKSTRLNSSHYS